MGVQPHDDGVQRPRVGRRDGEPDGAGVAGVLADVEADDLVVAAQGADVVEDEGEQAGVEDVPGQLDELTGALRCACGGVTRHTMAPSPAVLAIVGPGEPPDEVAEARDDRRDHRADEPGRGRAPEQREEHERHGTQQDRAPGEAGGQVGRAGERRRLRRDEACRRGLDGPVDLGLDLRLAPGARQPLLVGGELLAGGLLVAGGPARGRRRRRGCRRPAPRPRPTRSRCRPGPGPGPRAGRRPGPGPGPRPGPSARPSSAGSGARGVRDAVPPCAAASSSSAPGRASSTTRGGAGSPSWKWATMSAKRASTSRGRSPPSVPRRSSPLMRGPRP